MHTETFAMPFVRSFLRVRIFKGSLKMVLENPKKEFKHPEHFYSSDATFLN